MNDYIKRGYAKTAICSSCANPCSLAEKANNPCVTVIELARIPSADVAPVRHGKWIESNLIKDGRIFICSNCYMAWVSKKRTMDGMNYCPNCGARMDAKK